MKHDRIEDLVRSTYRGLAPPAAVEEELQTNLPAERAAPQHPKTGLLLSIATLVAAGVVLAIAWGRDGGTSTELADNGEGSGLELAVVARPKTGVVPRSIDEVSVRLATGGRLLVVSEKSWTQVSLDGLARHLEQAAVAGGKQKTAGGVEFSSLPVVLHLDRETPWLHIQWIMLVCSEKRMPRLAFAVQAPQGRDFLLDAALPTDLGVAQPWGKYTEVRLRVLVTAQEGRDGRPTRVLYRLGDTEAEELASVARWLASAQKSAASKNVKVRAEIKAAHTVPFHHVAKLLAEFRRAGYASVDFFGTQIPSADLRAAKELPYPTSEWGRQLPSEKAECDTPGLAFRIEEGDPADLDRAVRILRKRLKIAGFGQLEIRRKGEILLVAAPQDKATIEEVKSLVERTGATMEFHITVETNAPNFDYYWQRLRQALDAGTAFADACHLKPSERAKDDIDNKRYPLGLTWYTLSDKAKESYAKSRLPGGEHPYVLCRNDDCMIDAGSLENTTFRRNLEGMGSDWLVVFEVKQAHQKDMARLTWKEGEYMAIILDGQVHSAPVLQSALTTSGQISGNYTEQEARSLAALLGSEPLPLRLVPERGGR